MINARAGNANAEISATAQDANRYPEVYSHALNVIDGAAPLASSARRTKRLLTVARAAVTPGPVTSVRPPGAGV